MGKIHLKLFAAFREITGQGELEWPLQPGQTAGGIVAELLAEYPALAAGAGSALLMVNQRYASRDTGLQDGDVMALLPPVGGGWQ